MVAPPGAMSGPRCTGWSNRIGVGNVVLYCYTKNVQFRLCPEKQLTTQQDGVQVLLIELPVVRIGVAVGKFLFRAILVEASETEAVAVDGPQRVVPVADHKAVDGRRYVIIPKRVKSSKVAFFPSFLPEVQR